MLQSKGLCRICGQTPGFKAKLCHLADDRPDRPRGLAHLTVRRKWPSPPCMAVTFRLGRALTCAAQNHLAHVRRSPGCALLGDVGTRIQREELAAGYGCRPRPRPRTALSGDSCGEGRSCALWGVSAEITETVATWLLAWNGLNVKEISEWQRTLLHPQPPASRPAQRLETARWEHACRSISPKEEGCRRRAVRALPEARPGTGVGHFLGRPSLEVPARPGEVGQGRQEANKGALTGKAPPRDPGQPQSSSIGQR